MTNPANAYDWNFGTDAAFTRNGAGFFNLTTFNTTDIPTLDGFKLAAVHLNIKFSADLAVDDDYRIYYVVPPSGTEKVLVDWTIASKPLQNYTWTMIEEPNNQIWDATEIGNFRLVFETAGEKKADNAYVNVYEAWLTLRVMKQGPTLDVDIIDASDLGGYEFNLTWNPDVLVVDDIQYVDDPNFFWSHFVWLEQINHTAGWMRLVITLQLGTTIGVDGEGTVAKISFYYAPGTSVLDMTQTLLSDCFGNLYDHERYDGYFSSPPITVNPPVASFTFTPTQPLVDETISFDGSASYAQSPNPILVKYIWYFNESIVGPPPEEGQTNATKYNDAGADPTVTHEYPNNGPYTVNLTVIDRYNLTSSTTMSIGITGPPVPIFTEDLSSPEAGQLVTFNASDSEPGYDGDDFCPVAWYYWDFNDTTIKNLTTPVTTHTFSSAGLYYINLTVGAPGISPNIHTSYVYTDFLIHQKTVRAPTVPEFPVGAALEIGLGITVIYVLWRKSRKIRRVHPLHRG